MTQSYSNIYIESMFTVVENKLHDISSNGR